MIDLIGKNVNIDNPALMQYLFPQYKYVTDSFVHYTTRPIIYDGEQKYIKQLIDRNIPYISLKGKPHPGCDFNQPDQLAAFVYSKFDKEPPSYLPGLIDIWTEDEFIQKMKMIWACGPMALEAQQSNSVFEFYQSLVTSKHQAMLGMEKVLETSHPKQVMGALYTFLSRVLNPETKVSAGYQRILNTFYNQKAQKNIEKALTELAFDQQNIINDELKLHIFVYNLID